MVTSERGEAVEQHSLPLSILLHLFPGAVFTVVVALVATSLAPRGIDPVFVLFGSIGLVLVPLELGYLSLQARRTTGSWSPLAVVSFRSRPSSGRLALITVGLVLWFLVVTGGLDCSRRPMAR